MSVTDGFLTYDNLKSLQSKRIEIIKNNNGKFINRELLNFNSEVMNKAINSSMSLSLESFFDLSSEIIDLLYEILGYDFSTSKLEKCIMCAIFLSDKFVEKDYVNHPCFRNNMLYTYSIQDGISIYNKDFRSVLERLSNLEEITNIHTFIHLRYSINDLISNCDEDKKDICIYFTGKIIKIISQKITEALYLDDVLLIFSSLSSINLNNVHKVVDFLSKIKYSEKVISDIISIIKIDYDILKVFSDILLDKYTIKIMNFIKSNFEIHLYTEISEIILKYGNNKYYYKYLIFLYNNKLSYHGNMEMFERLCNICSYLPYYVDSCKSTMRICNELIIKNPRNIKDYFITCYLIVGSTYFDYNNETDCSRFLKILSNLPNNINTRVARYILMRDLIRKPNRNILNIELNESIFKHIEYNQITNRKLKKYLNEKIDVHDGERDSDTIKALNRLIEIYSTEWDSIDEDLTGFNEFWKYADEKLINEDRVKFTRIMGVPLTNEVYIKDIKDFSPLLVENTTILGNTFNPRNILSYLWYFANKPEYETENLPQSMLNGVLSSFQNKDGSSYCVCNQGKLQNLVIYVIQGRLKDKDGNIINIDIKTFEDLIDNSENEITPVKCYNLIKPFLDEISTKKCTLEEMFRELFEYIYINNLNKYIDMIIQVLCLYSESNDGFTINPSLSFASCYEDIFDLDDYQLAFMYNHEINEN